MTSYRVGIARKTNKQIKQWVAADGCGIGGYTSCEEEARTWPTYEEAREVAHREGRGQYRAVVQQA